jgi:hypothetical protein
MATYVGTGTARAHTHETLVRRGWRCRYGDAVPHSRRCPGAQARGWPVARRSTPMRETAVELHASCRRPATPS